MSELKRAIWFSSFVLLMALACAVVAFGYPADSSAFPRTIAVILALLASADLARNLNGWINLRQAASDEGSDDLTSRSVGRRKQLRIALLVFASAPFYIGMVHILDFEITTFLYLLTGMFLLGERNPVSSVIISVIVMLIVKVLFFVLLDVSRTTTILFGS